MLIEETVTYLEMTSPDELIPGRPPPTPMETQELDRGSAPLLRSTYARIAAPHGWIGRSAWSDEKWDEWLSSPSVQVWVARVGDEVAGMIELECQSAGEIEIVVLGLVPEIVGKGFGGHLLTLATQLAWEVESPGGTRTSRVWLHTSSRDHPHAKRNYERRGFRPFRTEHRQRKVPG
jgi:GNAT superfamily N-acetyltransferase